MHTSTRLLLFLLLWLPLTLVAEPLLLDDMKGVVETHPVFRHYEDKTRQLSVEDVSSPAYDKLFVSPASHPFNFGRNKSAHWIRFEIFLQSDLTWYLAINSVILAEYELYIFPSNHRASVGQQKNYKKIEQRLPTYRLSIEKSEAIYCFFTIK